MPVLSERVIRSFDQVLDGDLGPVLASCLDADLAARLDELEQ